MMMISAVVIVTPVDIQSLWVVPGLLFVVTKLLV